MKKFIKNLTTATLLLTVSQSTLIAEENIGIGFQSSGFSSNGLSVKADIGDKYVAQGVVGFFGDVNNYSVRGLYKFQENTHYNLYGYGSIGMWRWDSVFFGDESVLGYGAGAGIEYDLRALNSNMVPLFVNVELGMDFVNFDNYDYGGFGLGLGLHYKF